MRIKDTCLDSRRSLPRDQTLVEPGGAEKTLREPGKYAPDTSFLRKMAEIDSAHPVARTSGQPFDLQREKQLARNPGNIPRQRKYAHFRSRIECALASCNLSPFPQTFHLHSSFTFWDRSHCFITSSVPEQNQLVKLSTCCISARPASINSASIASSPWQRFYSARR